MSVKKKIVSSVRLNIKVGDEKRSSNIGTVLGPRKINIAEFHKKFSEATKDYTSEIGKKVRVTILVHSDKTFSLKISKPLTSELIKSKAGISKGSATSKQSDPVGKLTYEQCVEIAKYKMSDLKTKNLDSAVKIIIGTAGSMGVEILSC